MSYKLEWNDQGVVITFSDILSTKDLIKSNSELIGNSRIETVKYIISDFTHIKGATLDESAVEITKDFAVRANPINPNIRLAIVSDNEEIIKLIESFIHKSKSEIEGADYQHFTHINDAAEWMASLIDPAN
ncbi:hypothetical protein [Thiomicrorhabdus sediminis]|uniref:SpoIIAA-like n=1 Tax=Thiomicrorhabdus sediminis TaxID=2580412 RepID=A0A4V1HHX8_9GAMM|nr:hypothetical protein [Thiomicrorhabdus sediminis]QCU90573.1 hypothetical protein FE785_07970 [Thiomicrorhabdus sediminis]